MCRIFASFGGEYKRFALVKKNSHRIFIISWNIEILAFRTCFKLVFRIVIMYLLKNIIFNMPMILYICGFFLKTPPPPSSPLIMMVFSCNVIFITSDHIRTCFIQCCDLGHLYLDNKSCTYDYNNIRYSHFKEKQPPF